MKIICNKCKKDWGKCQCEKTHVAYVCDKCGKETNVTYKQGSEWWCFKCIKPTWAELSTAYKADKKKK